MPNRPIAGRAGVVFHVVNRAIEGQLLFRDFGDYLAFQRLLIRALDVVSIRLLAYGLMPNHWHFVLWPETDLQLTQFVRWLSMTHARNLRRWRGSEGRGAVFQSRYQASAVDTERYFYTMMRYVERNPARAGFVALAEDWMWSSASRLVRVQGVRLAAWPLARPDGWSAFLNDVEPQRELAFIRQRTRRNQPIAQPHNRDAILAIPVDSRVDAIDASSPRADPVEYAGTARRGPSSPDDSPDEES